MADSPTPSDVADRLAELLPDGWAVEAEGSGITARAPGDGRPREVGVEWDRGRFYARELTPHPLPNVPADEHSEELHDLEDALAHAAGWASGGADG